MTCMCLETFSLNKSGINTTYFEIPIGMFLFKNTFQIYHFLYNLFSLSSFNIQVQAYWSRPNISPSTRSDPPRLRGKKPKTQDEEVFIIDRCRTQRATAAPDLCRVSVWWCTLIPVSRSVIYCFQFSMICQYCLSGLHHTLFHLRVFKFSQLCLVTKSKFWFSAWIYISFNLDNL